MLESNMSKFQFKLYVPSHYQLWVTKILNLPEDEKSICKNNVEVDVTTSEACTRLQVKCDVRI